MSTHPFWRNENNPLEEYTPPKWAEGFKYKPTYRVKLAHLPTPIRKWSIPSVPKKFELFIKRDDLTGSFLSGNKVRKLEFSLAEAIDSGCTDVITMGDLHSNHCRTTTIAARQLGLQTHLVLKSDIQDPNEVPCTGNVLLSRMCGAEIHLFNPPEAYGEDFKQKMQQIADDIRKNNRGKAYIMSLGGSNLSGLYGYIEAYNEMVAQGILDNITDIVVPCGTSGTAAGLAIANYVVAGDKIRVHGFRVADMDSDYVYSHVRESLDSLGVSGVDPHQILLFHQGYLGQGYGHTTNEQQELMMSVSSTTGVILDPTYTGKCVYGMVEEMRTNPTIYKGNRVLFIHTGGIFGASQCDMGNVLKTGAYTNRCHVHKL